MQTKEIINSTLNTLSKTSKAVNEKYKEYIKTKAMEKVNKKLSEKNLKPQDLDFEDYEIMVSEEMRNIKEDHAFSVAKVGLGLVGLDLLFGW